MIMRSRSFMKPLTDKENKSDISGELSEDVNIPVDTNQDDDSKSVDVLDDNSSTKSMVDNFTPRPIPNDIYVGKMLWGKMKSHPWWPCMVCLSPENTFFMSTKSIDKVHVIYFGEYIERSWINIKSTMPYNGIESYRKFIEDLKSKNTAKYILSQYEVVNLKKKAHDFATNEAEEAYGCDLEKRIDDYSIEYLSTESEKEQEPIKKDPKKRGKKKLPKKEEYKVINTEDENIEFEFQRLKAPVFSGHKHHDVCFLCLGKHRATLYDEVSICGNKCRFMFHDKCAEVLYKYIQEEDKELIDFIKKDWCVDCNTGVRRCYVCMNTDTSIEPIKQCFHKECYNYYHISCVTKPPLRDYITNHSSTSQHNCNSSDKPDVSCPSHTCRACYIMNPKDVHVSTSYIRCLMCYAAFHRGEWCIPAGSMELSPMFIICPQHLAKSGNFDVYRAPFIDIISEQGEVRLDDHIKICYPNKTNDKKGRMTNIDLWYNSNKVVTKKKTDMNNVGAESAPKKERHHNVNFCMACGGGGLLICCEKCPVSMHEDCYKIDTSVAKYECDHCVEGMYPRYGDILWIKHGQHKWWPGQVIHERNAPPNLFKFKKAPGLFCVQFFGDNNYCWTNRKHVYQFETQDLDYHTSNGNNSVQKSNNKSHKISKLDETEFEKYSHLLSSDTIELAISKGDIRYRISIIIASKAVVLREALAMKLFYSTIKPKQYRHIKVNQPIGNVRIHNDRGGAGSNDRKRDDIYCNCQSTDIDPCGESSSCMNRSLRCECKPGRCKAGKACQNQRFTKREYPPQEIFRTKRCGWGIRSKGVIKRGQFVNEYVGELITYEEAKKRAQETYESKIDDHYMMMLDKNRVIDANRAGNLSRFMNHSCNPNLVCQFWFVNGDFRVGIFALRDIQPNEELSFSYNFSTFEDVETECFCGALNCNGKLSMKSETTDGPTNSSAIKKKTKDTKHKKLSKIKRKRKPENTKNGDNSDSLSNPVTVTTTTNSEDANEPLDDKENIISTESNHKIAQRRSQRKMLIASKGHTKATSVVKDLRNQKNSKSISDESVQAITISTTLINREWENQCFRCGKQGGLDVYCEHTCCPRAYHRLCLDLDRSVLEKNATDKQGNSWLCPWHYCDICGHTSYHFCLDCTSSWCSNETCWTIAGLPVGITVTHQSEGKPTVISKPPSQVRCSVHQPTADHITNNNSPQSHHTSEIESVTSTTGLTVATESLVSL